MTLFDQLKGVEPKALIFIALFIIGGFVLFAEWVGGVLLPGLVDGVSGLLP